MEDCIERLYYGCWFVMLAYWFEWAWGLPLISLPHWMSTIVVGLLLHVLVDTPRRLIRKLLEPLCESDTV
jgi:hypothetical protein